MVIKKLASTLTVSVFLIMWYSGHGRTKLMSDGPEAAVQIARKLLTDAGFSGC